MAEVDLGAVKDFRDRAVTVVSASNLELGIVRLSDEVYALRNICPHQGGPVCRGGLVPRLESESAGSVRALDGTPVITCAWHGWEFDVRTGRSVWDDSYGVKVYPARVKDGRVLVELGRRKGVVSDAQR